jgi:hypothetical protein
MHRTILAAGSPALDIGIRNKTFEAPIKIMMMDITTSISTSENPRWQAWRQAASAPRESGRESQTKRDPVYLRCITY